MQERPVIIFKNVSKTYNLYKNDKQRLKGFFLKKGEKKIKRALNDISFSVNKGESIAFLGKNGSGKSTLLKLITQVAYPTEGILRVTGRVSALLELTAGFEPEFTGRENIYFRGHLLGVPDEEIKALEQEIIDFADIGEYINQPVRTYSSGMKARLGFAINVNVRPEILIVDEALSVGDKYFSEKCRKKVREVVDSGVTFLLVTHSTATAKSFCKRGIVIKEGNILFDGDISDAISYYNTKTN